LYLTTKPNANAFGNLLLHRNRRARESFAYHDLPFEISSDITGCSLDEFSALDELQEKYQVSFVISAGNYDTPPLLDFPRNQLQLEAGRIITPADSVFGITVGAVSHIDYKKNGPNEHHPSAFSRTVLAQTT
jgi:hypothetical protein